MPALVADETSVKMTHHQFEAIAFNTIRTTIVVHSFPPVLEDENRLFPPDISAAFGRGRFRI